MNNRTRKHDDAPQAALPPQGGKGVYALLFELAQPLSLQVGRLGLVSLPAGGLVYVGSARGAGGLRARLARHLRSEKKMHWHIDALSTVLCPVTWLADASGQYSECDWAQRLAAQPAAWVPAPGFGNSDCHRGCPAHLIAFPPHACPDLKELLAPSTSHLVYYSLA